MAVLKKSKPPKQKKRRKVKKAKKTPIPKMPARRVYIRPANVDEKLILTIERYFQVNREIATVALSHNVTPITMAAIVLKATVVDVNNFLKMGKLTKVMPWDVGLTKDEMKELVLGTKTSNVFILIDSKFMLLLNTKLKRVIEEEAMFFSKKPNELESNIGIIE